MRTLVISHLVNWTETKIHTKSIPSGNHSVRFQTFKSKWKGAILQMGTPIPIWFWQLSFFPISILCSLWWSHPDLSKVNWKHLAASIMTSITCHSPHLYRYFLWQLNTGRITWMQKMEGALNNLYIQELTLPKPMLACLPTPNGHSCFWWSTDRGSTSHFLWTIGPTHPGGRPQPPSDGH